MDDRCCRGKAPDFNTKLASRVRARVSTAVHGTIPLLASAQTFTGRSTSKCLNFFFYAARNCYKLVHGWRVDICWRFINIIVMDDFFLFFCKHNAKWKKASWGGLHVRLKRACKRARVKLCSLDPRPRGLAYKKKKSAKSPHSKRWCTCSIWYHRDAKWKEPSCGAPCPGPPHEGDGPPFEFEGEPPPPPPLEGESPSWADFGAGAVSHRAVTDGIKSTQSHRPSATVQAKRNAWAI